MMGQRVSIGLLWAEWSGKAFHSVRFKLRSNWPPQIWEENIPSRGDN